MGHLKQNLTPFPRDPRPPAQAPSEDVESASFLGGGRQAASPAHGLWSRGLSPSGYRELVRNPGDHTEAPALSEQLLQGGPPHCSPGEPLTWAPAEPSLPGRPGNPGGPSAPTSPCTQHRERRVSAHRPGNPGVRGAEQAGASVGHQLTPLRVIQPSRPPASFLGAPRGREGEGAMVGQIPVVPKIHTLEPGGRGLG